MSLAKVKSLVGLLFVVTALGSGTGVVSYQVVAGGGGGTVEGKRTLIQVRQAKEQVFGGTNEKPMPKATSFPSPPAEQTSPASPETIASQRAHELFGGVTAHYFGIVPSGTQLEYAFKMTNVYRAPVDIQNVHSSCGCVSAKTTKKQLLPGESGSIEVEMDTRRFVGSHTVTIFVDIGSGGVTSTTTLSVTAVSADGTDISFSRKKLAPKIEAELIQGKWEVYSAFDNKGTQLPIYASLLEVPYNGVQLTDRLISLPMLDANSHELSWSYRLDTEQNPPTITITKGELQKAGYREMKGIYRLEGDTLTIIFDKSGKAERPKSFDIGDLSDNAIYLLLRRRPQIESPHNIDLREPRDTVFRIPEPKSGTIQKVEVKGAKTLVEVSMGAKDGFKKGDTLEVYRLRPGPVYLGAIRIVDIREDSAVGQYVSTPGRPEPDFHVGDIVSKSLPSSAK